MFFSPSYKKKLLYLNFLFSPQKQNAIVEKNNVRSKKNFAALPKCRYIMDITVCKQIFIIIIISNFVEKNCDPKILGK